MARVLPRRLAARVLIGSMLAVAVSTSLRAQTAGGSGGSDVVSSLLTVVSFLLTPAGIITLLGVVFLYIAINRREGATRLKEEAKNSRSPSVPGGASTRKAVFLSYRRDDAIDITGRLYDKLVSALGKDTVFKDIDSIPLGSDFRAHIDDGLKSCKVFLLIIGQKWLGDNNGLGARRIDDPRDFVRLEVETALRRNIPVIPVLVHGASIPLEESLPEGMRGIAYRQAIQLRSDPDFHRDTGRIVSFLEMTL